MIVRKTAALAISFARLANSFFLSEIRSMAASIAELISSTISTKNILETNNTFCIGLSPIKAPNGIRISAKKFLV